MQTGAPADPLCVIIMCPDYNLEMGPGSPFVQTLCYMAETGMSFSQFLKARNRVT